MASAIDRARRASERDRLKQAAGVDTDAPVTQAEVDAAAEVVLPPEVLADVHIEETDAVVPRTSPDQVRSARESYEAELKAARRKTSSELMPQQPPLTPEAATPQSISPDRDADMEGMTVVTRSDHARSPEGHTTVRHVNTGVTKSDNQRFIRSKDSSGSGNAAGPTPAVRLADRLQPSGL